MTLTCFVLAKRLQSYTYVGYRKFEDDVTVDVVVHRVRGLASSHCGWNWETTNVEIDLYQVSSHPPVCSLL